MKLIGWNKMCKLVLREEGVEAKTKEKAKKHEGEIKCSSKVIRFEDKTKELEDGMKGAEWLKLNRRKRK